MKEYDALAIIRLFTENQVVEYRTINSSHGEEDFREVIDASLENHERIIVKLACNAFTNPDSIRMWKRCASEYSKLGYYCPKIYATLNNDFPLVRYKGYSCVAYAEEYSKYQSVKQARSAKPFRDELYVMTARVADKRFDFTNNSSGYVLFDVFPGDQVDEVTENALEFMEYCNNLPEQFGEQSKRIFARWEENRKRLKEIYFKLPFSVFQADFNDTNVLVDDGGNFVGIYDFNLAGRDEILNYLLREIYDGTFEEERREILRALEIVSKHYKFSDLEIMAAPLIYRCVKPLWFTRVQQLKKSGTDITAIQKCLDEIEHAQTDEIDFESVMRL